MVDTDYKYINQNFVGTRILHIVAVFQRHLNISTQYYALSLWRFLLKYFLFPTPHNQLKMTYINIVEESKQKRRAEKKRALDLNCVDN